MDRTAEPPPLQFAQPRQGDSVVRGTAFSFLSKIAGAVFTGSLTIFLARRLGSHSFGVYSLGLSIIGLVSLVSDFGVAVALPRFLAEHRDDRQRLSELVADGIRLELLGSLLVAGALAALSGPLAAAYNAPGLGAPLRFLALSLVGQNFLFFFSGVFTGMRHQALNLAASFIESVTEFTVSVALVLIAGGAAAAAAGRALCYVVGGITGLVLAIRLLSDGIVPRSVSPHGHVRRIVSYSVTLWVVDSVYTIFTQVDSLLIGALLSAGSVAFFSAPMRLILLVQYPGYAIGSAVSPRLARRSGVEPDAGAFHRAIRLILLIGIPAATVTTVWASPIIFYALGDGYGKADGVLRALGPYVVLSGVGVLVSTGLNYLGGARRRIPVAVATVLVNLVVDLILIPQIGVVGGAVGSDAGMAIYVLAQFVFCVRMLGLELRPYVEILVRSLLAVVPMAAILLALGTGRIGVAVVIGGALAGLIVYGVMLRVVGEVTADEVRAATLVVDGLATRLLARRR